MKRRVAMFLLAKVLWPMLMRVEGAISTLLLEEPETTVILKVDPERKR